MHVAIILLRTGVAGHTRSGLTVGTALVKRGHEVSLFVSRGADLSVVASSDLRYFPVADLPDRPSMDLLQALGQLHASQPIDVVHSFNQRGLSEAMWFGYRNSVRVAHTLCGGPPARDILDVPGMVVFTEEQRRNFAHRMRSGTAGPLVLPNRVDFDDFAMTLNARSPSDRSEFLQKYDIDPAAPILMRISRVKPKYERSVLEGVAAVQALNAAGCRCSFLHIGVVQDQASMSRIAEAVRTANALSGTTIAASVQDEATNAAQWLPLASVVLGAGRSAIEAMFAGIPVIVLGDAGFSGLVTKESVAEQAAYNFAGRDVSVPLAPEDSVARLVDALRTIWQHPDTLRELSKFTQQWASENMDVHTGVPKYEHLWEHLSPPSTRQLLELSRFSATRWGRIHLARIKRSLGV